MTSEGIRLTIVVYQDLYHRANVRRDEPYDIYERSSALIWLSTADMNRLGVIDRDCVEVHSEIAKVVVRAYTFPECNDGIGYMPPSLYTTSLTRYDRITAPMLNLRRIEAAIHKTEASITPLLALVV